MAESGLKSMLRVDLHTDAIEPIRRCSVNGVGIATDIPGNIGFDKLESAQQITAPVHAVQPPGHTGPLQHPLATRSQTDPLYHEPGIEIGRGKPRNIGFADRVDAI